MDKVSRILIVDDEVMFAAMLAQELSSHGYAVDVAHNGADGLSLANAHDYDAILLDVLMPIMDGHQMYESLLASHPSAAARVIFMTGHISFLDSTRERFLKSGEIVLKKPLTFSQLHAALQKIIPPRTGLRPKA